MELANIEKLLAKYLEATTSLQEEALLKTYFTSDNVAPHLQEYRNMFQYFAKSQSDTFTKTIRLKARKQRRKWLSIAATIALLIGGYTLINTYMQQQEAQKAYADTKQAFEMIAFHINKGKLSVIQLDKFKETTHKVFKEGLKD